MFTKALFMQRRRAGLRKELVHWCAPVNGFDNKSMRVSRVEFHDLCIQDSDIFISRKIYGVSLNT